MDNVENLVVLVWPESEWYNSQVCRNTETAKAVQADIIDFEGIEEAKQARMFRMVEIK